MKHGPIALIDENMPVVCLAPKDAVYDKMISQIEQAKARNAIVIAVATDGDRGDQAQGRSRDLRPAGAAAADCRWCCRCRCRCWRTTSPCGAAWMSISRAIWRRA